MLMKLQTPPEPRTLAEFVRGLGGVPLERILAYPPIGSATEDDLIAVREGYPGRVCELIDGTLVEKAMGTRESLMASLLYGFIWNYLSTHDLGRLFDGASPFKLRPGNVRLPDVSFVPWDRMPTKGEDDAFWAITPTLIVEVLSRTNRPREIARKLEELFNAGCLLAWVIDPKKETARIYTTSTLYHEIDSTGTLAGGKILPGFKLRLSTLFAETDRRE